MVWFAVVLAGLLCGVIAWAIARRWSSSLIADVLVSLAGATLATFVPSWLGQNGEASNFLWNVGTASIGAVVLLVIYLSVMGTGQRAEPRA